MFGFRLHGFWLHYIATYDEMNNRTLCFYCLNGFKDSQYTNVLHEAIVFIMKYVHNCLMQFRASIVQMFLHLPSIGMSCVVIPWPNHSKYAGSGSYICKTLKYKLKST